MVFPYRTLPNVLINYFHSPIDGVVQTKSEVILTERVKLNWCWVRTYSGSETTELCYN